MPHERRLPSVFSILRFDYAAGLAAVVPAVLWVMYLAIAQFGFFPGFRGRDPLGYSDAPFFFYAAVVTTLVGIPSLVWRVSFLRALVARCVEVVGRVTGVSFYRDRGRVEFEYAYQGQTYHSGSAVWKTRRTQSLQPGAELALIVDPANPVRALIRDLYV